MPMAFASFADCKLKIVQRTQIHFTEKRNTAYICYTGFTFRAFSTTIFKLLNKRTRCLLIINLTYQLKYLCKAEVNYLIFNEKCDVIYRIPISNQIELTTYNSGNRS